MRVVTLKKELTAADISSVLSAHANTAQRILKLKRYYNGRHDILFNKAGRKFGAPNNRLVSNYPRYITNMATGFFIGQPVAYQAAAGKEKELEILLDIFKYNDEAAHNLQLATELSVTGESYEVLYIDGDANIRFCAVPSEEMIMVCEATLEENPICAIRHYKVYGLDGSNYDEFVDVYDADKITHYSCFGSSLKLISEEQHYFGDVPVVEYINNYERRGDFEDVMTLVDAYNMAQSLTLDDLMDFTDAFLILKNLLGTDEEDIQRLRKDKAIMLPSDGDASWLIKNINDTYVENVKNRLQKDIHKFSHVPDMSDENFTGNTSGVAIKYKLIGLEQIRSRKEREFKKSLQRRIEIIAGMLKLKNQAQIDFRDIDFQFTANIPANILEQAQIVNQLDGLVSQKTLIGLLPFVADPAEEVEKLSGERNEEIKLSDAGNYPALKHEHGGKENDDRSSKT